MSDEDDPFERLGDVEREGDPFERLEEGADADGQDDGVDEPDRGDVPDDTDEVRVPDDPFAEFERDGASSPAAASDAAASTDEPAASDSEADRTAVDPFSDEPDREGDPFGGGESVFERVDVGEVDADEIWASMTEDDGDDEPVVPDESRYAEVSKHAYCEQCEFFAEPPDAHCTHESAEIIEYLDMDRVRLMDCPIVAERAELE
jgi:hypothetical protein